MTSRFPLVLSACTLLLFAAACAPDAGDLTGPTPPLEARGGKPGTPPPPPPPPPAGVCNYDQDGSVLDASGWTRVFTDEFTASGPVDPFRWLVWRGGAFNEELQHYQADALSVSSGWLTIAAEKRTVEGRTHPWDETLRTFGWTSGRIESVQHFSASPATPVVRMAARLQLPPGYGLWPAFWSYGDPWPTQGEIDIMEARGQEPLQYNTAFWYGRREGMNQVSNSATVIPVAVSLTDCAHVFEVEWAERTLTYYFDGVVVDVKTQREIRNMFGKQQRITLNLAVGGLFFSNLDPALIQPGTLKVDWVRAWTRN